MPRTRNRFVSIFVLLAGPLVLGSCTAESRATNSDANAHESVDGGPSDAGATDDAGAPDGGPTDAGCPQGETHGPGGVCQSCAGCSSDADCLDGTCVADGMGCTTCEASNVCQGRGCREQADCCLGQSCVSPNEPAPCGICVRNPHECDENSPCPSGQVCAVAPPLPCSSCDPDPARVCVDPCSVGTCGEGSHCAPSGACEANTCATDFACAAFMDCRPDGGDAHGCALRACAQDSDCAAGVCVKGTCAASVGTCSFAVP